jgi:hypothetical protein
VTERAPQHRRTTGRPPGGDVRASDVSRDRLGAQLSTEVAATRAAWTDALLRSDAALRAGDADRARRALDDQRLLLTQLQRRLDRAVSSALVEREAEQLLRHEGLEAVGGPAAHGVVGDDGPTAGHDEPRARRADRLPRALTGAAAAMVIGVVALIVGTAPPPTPEIAAMTDTAPVVDAEPADVGPAWATVDPAPAPADELRHLAPVDPVPSEPAAEDAPGPADAPPEPAPEAEAEAPADDDARERAEEGIAAPETAPEPQADDEADGDEAPEEEADEETLTEHLPSLDRPISERLGQRIEGLLEP